MWQELDDHAASKMRDEAEQKNGEERRKAARYGRRKSWLAKRERVISGRDWWWQARYDRARTRSLEEEEEDRLGARMMGWEAECAQFGRVDLRLYI